MRTEEFKITDELEGKEEVLIGAEKFSAENGLTGKSALHFRLLTEEAVSMVNGIMDDFVGKLWFESERTEKGLVCRIHLSADKGADSRQESLLLSVASSGKNEGSKGILGKIRELFRINRQIMSESGYMPNTYPESWYDMGYCGSALNTGAAMSYGFWSLTAYQNNLADVKDEAAEAWDELEKSIITKLADDVKVWLKKDSTEMVIEKQF